jgi:hypothetical protein
MKKMSNGNTMQQQCVCYFVYTAIQRSQNSQWALYTAKSPPPTSGLGERDFNLFYPWNASTRL